MKKKVNLFAYGTLQDPGIQKMIWGKEITGQADVLHGYKLMLLNKRLLFIEPGDGVVVGTVYQIPVKSLPNVDHYESNFYKREIVTLDSGVKAYAYIIAN